MKYLAGVAVALLCAGGASPLSAQGGVPVIPADSVQAFAVVAAGAIDSLVARTKRDTLVLTIRNGARVVIWKAPVARFRHLSDSLAVWCRDLCAPEWDEVYAIPSETTTSLPGSTWGVRAIHADSAWALGATGRGVIVTALDSGLDPTHPGYVIAGGYNPSGGAWTDDIGVCNGHGTHTGGTMADRTGRGVAPDAVLYGVKVFQLNNGQCLASTSYQVAGLNWAVANGSRCVNISIGGTTTSAAYQNTIASARNAGVVISAANGNAGTTPPLFPGRADYLLGVASVGHSLARSYFSNTGPTTDLAGPGEGVESTMPGGGYGTKSGTSMAAPHVAGACALVLSVRPDLSADAVMDLLRSTADSLGAHDLTGYGLVRPDRAIAALALEGPSVAAAPRTYTTTQTECEQVNGSIPFTATTDAAWLTVWTTADRRVCWTADLSRAPVGTTTAGIFLRSLP